MRFPSTFATALSPAPMDPFPPPALRTVRADCPHTALQWDHAPRTRSARSEQLPAMPVARGPSGDGTRQVPEVARLHPRCPSPTRRRACSRPDGTGPGRSGPFAYACDASGLSALSRGVARHCHSRRPSPVRHPSTPGAPFLSRHYPASAVLRAPPPPCRPGLPLTGFRSPRAQHQQGFPCCHVSPLPRVPAPLPRRKWTGVPVALCPAHRRPSPYCRRVGSRETSFEACSAFTARSGPRGR